MANIPCGMLWETLTIGLEIEENKMDLVIKDYEVRLVFSDGR